MQFSRLKMGISKIWPLVAIGLVLTLGLTPAWSQEQLTDEQIANIESLIHKYIVEHPEVIVESVRSLREREETAARERAQQNLVDLREKLISDPNAPAVGAAGADVTIVEFFDYRCGYCKASLAAIQQILDEDKNVRVVFKEFPILSPESERAARAALAAHRQGKYFDLHNALMAARGSFSDDQIMEIAQEVGVDLSEMRRDMDSPEIQAMLDENMALAQALDISGTPTFIIGDSLYPGALDVETLREMIAKQRSSS